MLAWVVVAVVLAWWCAAAGWRSTSLGAGAVRRGLIAAHAALGDALAADVALDHARGAVAGSIAAALLVLVISHTTSAQEPWRTPRDDHGLGLLCGAR